LEEEKKIGDVDKLSGELKSDKRENFLLRNKNIPEITKC